MKLANVRLTSGERALIAMRADGTFVDLSSFIEEGVPTIRALLEGGVELLDRARSSLETARLMKEIDIASYLPVSEADSKVFCVGVNYTGHAEELGREVPKIPAIFARYGTTCIGHEAPIVLPRSSSKVDWEGELALVIGKGGRYLSEDEALSALAGATVFNDLSMRDFQEHFPQITLAKNFDGSGCMGPWLATSDEIDDYLDLDITTTVNGKVMQQANTNEFVFSLAFLVSTISQVCRLRPGDVISTGTPAGVAWGQRIPEYLKAGDIVEVEIERIGKLKNVCQNEGSDDVTGVVAELSS